jgi:hypothetical protein
MSLAFKQFLRSSSYLIPFSYNSIMSSTYKQYCNQNYRETLGISFELVTLSVGEEDDAAAIMLILFCLNDIDKYSTCERLLIVVILLLRPNSVDG